MSKYLTRKHVLSAHGFRTAEVEAPELDGVFLVRELTAPEITHLGFRSTKQGKDRKFMADIASLGDQFPDIVSWCVIDEDNKSILTRNDIEQLSARYFLLMQRIVIKVLQLSKLVADPDDKEEEAEKKAEPLPEA